MAIKMLVFDFRDSEREFFNKNNLENFDITFIRDNLNDETVKNLSQEELENTSVISVFIDSEVTENVINSFKNLRIIATRSTGVDHIDQKAAMAKNIAVVNVEGYGSKSVAQYTIGLLIALIRNIVPASKHVGNDNSVCTDFMGRDISNLTLGVVGTGAIGAAVCKLAHALDMKILAYDKIQKQEIINNYGVQYVEFEDLVSNSDVITLHLPYTGENGDLFTKKQFEMMKNTSYLINTSRGELVNTRALYEAITNGNIKGAALDVVVCEDASFRCSDFAKRADVKLECYEEAVIVKELVKLPTVIVTPHIAYETYDAVNYILEICIIGILDSIKGGYTYRVC